MFPGSSSRPARAPDPGAARLKARFPGLLAGTFIAVMTAGTPAPSAESSPSSPSGSRPAGRVEPGPDGVRQITRGPGGRILTNIGVWSPDGEWIAYDTRSDAAGDRFDGRRIEMVRADTGEVRTLFESTNGAFCGVVTFHPRDPEVVFILGPEHPTPDWSYNAWHRQGAVVAVDRPGRARLLDARDVVAPFTPGALRGGSHVHVWNAAGDLLSFTYEDHVLATRPADRDVLPPGADLNQRNVGVSVRGRPVRVPATHPRNHDGETFSVLVTRTVSEPRPGSDDLVRACEEGWVGTAGYRRADGSWQRRALAFQGTVLVPNGAAEPVAVPEVFLVDLPDDLTRPGDAPLEGTAWRRPAPPHGVVPRRLTRTTERRFPGIQGPRHWLRAAPDGSAIAFLARDDDGVVQLWTVSPLGGPPRQITRQPTGIASAFTWSPDGRSIAHIMDGSVCVTDVATGLTRRLTPRTAGPDPVGDVAAGGAGSGNRAGGGVAPNAGEWRPEACVVSPDGTRIACVRRRSDQGTAANQICVVPMPKP